MDVNMWMALESAMQPDAPRRPLRRATLRRVATFARPYRARLTVFLALSTVGAVLGVATPVLAGRAVEAIVDGEGPSTVLALAAVIAALAVAAAAVGLLERLQSAKVGEGLIFDLRRTVYDHVQSMPVAFFTRTPHGGARQPPQQRRDRRPTGLYLGPVGRRHQPHSPGSHRGGDGPLVVAGHAPGPRAAARLRGARPAGGKTGWPARTGGGRPQRGHDLADDRAVLGPRGDARQAVRPARGGVGRVRPAGGPGARHRGAFGHGHGGVRPGPHARLGPGPGPHLRPRRLAGLAGRPVSGHGRHPGPAVEPLVRPAHLAGHRPPRRDHRPGQLRAGLRGARHRTDDHRPPGCPGPTRGAGGRRARGRLLLLPGGRPGLARLPGGRGQPRQPGRRGGAPRRDAAGRAGPDGRPGGPLGGRQVDAGRPRPPPLRRGPGRRPPSRGRRSRPVATGPA